MASIELKNIEKSFGTNKVINKFDIKINDGEFIVLVGPSGCGKSTLLRMISGLETVDIGEIYLDNKLINNLIPSKREIAMVFQSYALYPHMNVFENMAFGLKMEKISKSEINQKVNNAAATLQIEDLLERKPKELSGGQRQRVAIGRAITRSPKVFLFDEPLSNLDAALRSEMRVEISKLHKKMNSNIIYVTHDQIEAMTLADRIAVMKNGVIQQLDSPKEIYNKPASLFVADFIGSPSMNFFNGKFVSSNNSFALNNSLINLNNYHFENIPSDQTDIIFGIRPEDISVSDSKESRKFKIELIEPMGADTLIWLSFEDIPFSVRLEGSSEYKLGDVININFDIKRASVFDKKSESRL